MNHCKQLTSESFSYSLFAFLFSLTLLSDGSRPDLSAGSRIKSSGAFYSIAVTGKKTERTVRGIVDIAKGYFGDDAITIAMAATTLTTSLPIPLLVANDSQARNEGRRVAMNASRAFAQLAAPCHCRFFAAVVVVVVVLNARPISMGRKIRSLVLGLIRIAGNVRHRTPLTLCAVAGLVEFKTRHYPVPYDLSPRLVLIGQCKSIDRDVVDDDSDWSQMPVQSGSEMDAQTSDRHTQRYTSTASSYRRHQHPPYTTANLDTAKVISLLPLKNNDEEQSHVTVEDITAKGCYWWSVIDHLKELRGWQKRKKGVRDETQSNRPVSSSTEWIATHSLK